MHRRIDLNRLYRLYSTVCVNRPGACLAGGGEGGAGGCSRGIAFVDADVEAGLLELLFDVDLTLLDEGLEVGAHPGNLGEGEAMLCNVDCLAGEVRRGGVARGGCGVGVAAFQVLLELDSAHGGVDL